MTQGDIRIREPFTHNVSHCLSEDVCLIVQLSIGLRAMGNKETIHQSQVAMREGSDQSFLITDARRQHGLPPLVNDLPCFHPNGKKTLLRSDFDASLSKGNHEPKAPVFGLFLHGSQ
jgi:hypothetical protein